MEQLDNLIYDTVSTLRSNKKQPNENAIYSLLSSKSESLSKDQLEERLNCRKTTHRKKFFLYRNQKSQFVLLYRNAHPTRTTDNPDNDWNNRKYLTFWLNSSSTRIGYYSNVNLQRFTNENNLVKEKIQNLAAEIDAVKMFSKEQLHLQKKSQKDESDEEEHSNENTEIVQLLRQKKRFFTWENASKNEIIKILSENLSIVNTNTCDTNAKPGEIYQTVKKSL